MALTPITEIRRYISIDEKIIVRISRSKQEMDYYSDPPVELKIVWGYCLDAEPDSFRETGSLRDVLMQIATRPMIVASAVAAPRRFAEMVSVAYDLGKVI